jgi:protein TonB
MLDSTARAERIDPPASEVAFYTWEVAQKPVAVRMPLAFIDRLESEAVENFRSLSSRGSEIGGLLIGSVAANNPSLVTVADFELVSCDYSRGPLYRLSDADMGRFAQAMEKYRPGSAQRVVGFFRSHTRKGLSLDAEDLAFVEPHFPEAQQFVLLIRPFATKVSTAGIFIRENGKISGDVSPKEFSFRSSELGMSHAHSEKAEPAAAPPPAPKAQPRAQIVPIASRREITLPEPVATVPAPPLVAERMETPAPAPTPPKAQPPTPVVEKVEKEEKPEKAEKAEKTEKTEKAVVLPPVPEVAPTPKPAAPVVAAEEIALPALPKRNKKLKLVVAAAIGMLVLGGGGLVVYPMLIKHGSLPTSTTPQDTSPLSLRVERTSGGMLLTWNRDLPVIQSASKVVLSISDGDRHENIELDPNQVRTGSILYPPMTGDVSFQMEVTDPHKSKTTSESLRVLDPRPSPLQDPAALAASGAAKDAAAKSTPASAAIPAPGTTPAAAPVEDTKPADDTPAPKAPAVALKPFNTESLAQRLRPATSTDLPEAPAIVRATPATALNLPGVVTSQPAAPAPPPPAPKQAQVTGGQLIPAKVISRVDPEYPKLARQAGASGLVEMEATIGLDGKVKNPHVLRGNAMLQKAAIDAVLQWRYKPAMLNGKPVESPVDIKLEFVSQGR